MISIAIDGPAGAGKSTIAKIVAEKLGYIYVDTGAMYRTIGYYAKTMDIADTDEKIMKQNINNIKMKIKHINSIQHIFLNNMDITHLIHSPKMSEAASNVSALKCVREYLLEFQRDFAKNNNIVMDGRDIGTVVLPCADVKIFLTASVESRAKRRYEEYMQKGENVKLEDIIEDMKKRDEKDSTRKIAPLKKASDSIELDTSGFELEDSVNLVLSTIKGRLNI